MPSAPTQSNLILSDQRAESVANVMSDVYGIPPENLATQGYGEQLSEGQYAGAGAGKPPRYHSPRDGAGAAGRFEQ
jgi:outer membrane protein OmpA-like peptidoglycan-associated protein